MALLAFAGCGKQTSVTTLRFVAWGNEREESSFRALIAEFEKKHPHIKVELQITPWKRVFDKLMISTAGGRPPDVSRVSSEWFAPLAAKGLLEPLDGYVKRDHYDLDDFYPQAVNGWGRYKGALYTIPTDIDVHAMYYNKTMFDKCHQPYPDWSWDWNRYVEVGKALTRDTNGDGRIDQWGCSLDPYWANYAYANGGGVLSKDMNRFVLCSPSGVGGVRFMGDLVNEYRVAPPPEETSQLGNMKLFTTGKIGMLISGSWAAELIFKDQIKDFEYDVAPLPKGPKARVTFIGGAAYAMLSRSKHKKEAWELVKWMTGREYQTSRVLDSQIVPSRKSVAGIYERLKRPPNHRKVFIDMIFYGRPTPAVSCSPEMNEIIKSELDLVILGKESASEACDKLRPVIDELLRYRD